MDKSLVPRALTIAGSDSGGGAGIEADLKVFTALGVYGMAAVTAVTAQNTLGVHGVEEVSPGMVRDQIDAVASDIGVDAAKTGMLANAGIIGAVAEAIPRHGIVRLVVDPVMVATTGARLLRGDAREALIRLLLPVTYLVTPNIPEAEALTGVTVHNEADWCEAAARLLTLGPQYVLIKGGHWEGPEAVDVLFGAGGPHSFRAPRLESRHTHGAGCTLSAAITANLAKGRDLVQSVHEAKGYLTEALRRGIPLGHGHGPLNHGWGIRSAG